QDVMASKNLSSLVGSPKGVSLCAAIFAWLWFGQMVTRVSGFLLSGGGSEMLLSIGRHHVVCLVLLRPKTATADYRRFVSFHKSMFESLFLGLFRSVSAVITK